VAFSTATGTPKQNIDTWAKKINATVARDDMVYFKFKKIGWRVAVIWECAIRDKIHLQDQINTLAGWLKSESEYIEIPEFFAELGDLL